MQWLSQMRQYWFDRQEWSVCRSFLTRGVDAEVDLQMANDSKVDSNYVEDWVKSSVLKNENTHTYRTQLKPARVKMISFSPIF